MAKAGASGGRAKRASRSRGRGDSGKISNPGYNRRGVMRPGVPKRGGGRAAAAKKTARRRGARR